MANKNIPSNVIQTTIGALSLSGSNTGHIPMSGPWTTNSYGSSGHVMAGPQGHMLWSTYRFDAREWKAGTVARLFSSPKGESGQGSTEPLTGYDTNVLSSGRLPVAVQVKGLQWELRRARPSGPIEEIAMIAEEEPCNLEESLMGLLAAASISFESSQTIFGGILMNSDAPKGPLPWKGISDWRGGHSFTPHCFSIPAGCSFAIRVDILDTWKPVYPVSLRVLLEIA